MSVMTVADMGMRMSCGGVRVFMGMPEGAIGIDPFQLLRAVVVLVMKITSGRVVAMAVGMTQRLT
jgi:hypothetical protein